jgi:hypothetical protein
MIRLAVTGVGAVFGLNAAVEKAALPALQTEMTSFAAAV